MGLLNGRRSGTERVSLRHSRAPGHLQKCPDCQAAVVRERQYLERLRRAAVPEASQDFTARLIEHTERLAQAGDSECMTPGSGIKRGLRVLCATAAGFAVSAGVLAAAAYALGGEVPPQASDRGEQDVRTLVSSTMAASATPQLPVAGSDPGRPKAIAAAANLNSQQLSELRKDGWACPEMASMGYHLDSAVALIQDGHPAVELHLSDGEHYATLVEEHLEGTGSSGTRWSVTPGTPWQAVYSSPVAVLRYTSDVPAGQASRALPELVKAGDSLLAKPAATTGDTLNGRLQRGLRALAASAGF
ncbi:hypothetical protein AB6813_05165 [bacterium RCC_150]